jgi:urease accessory protein
VSLRRAGALALLGAGAAPAWAHSSVEGIGNFYNGALHPLVSPAHLIALLALGLWLGQRGLGAAKRPLLAFMAALALGLCLHHWAGDPDTDRWLLVLAALFGLLVAAARALPAALAPLLCAGVGLAVGLASGPTGLESTARAVSLFGTFFSATLVCAYVMAIVTLAQRPWMLIAARVLGSWLAAAAVLVLALALKGVQGAGA